MWRMAWGSAQMTAYYVITLLISIMLFPIALIKVSIDLLKRHRLKRLKTQEPDFHGEQEDAE